MILVELLAFTALAAVQPVGGAPITAPGLTEITKDDAQAMISKCGARKFETFADVPEQGTIKRRKMTLCAPDSDSHEAWISKLEKAATAIQANPNIPSEPKAKLLADFGKEIMRLKGMPASADAVMPKPRVPVVAEPGAIVIPQVPVATAPQAPPQGQLPLATPIAAAPVVAAPNKPTDIPAYVPVAGAVNRFALVARCLPPGNRKSQPCEHMAPNERIEIRAEHDIATPVTLMFRQTGKGMFGASDKEEEVELASNGLRRGETVLVRVPKRICSGFHSRFEIEVRAKNPRGGYQSPQMLGPFEMRCES